MLFFVTVTFLGCGCASLKPQAFLLGPSSPTQGGAIGTIAENSSALQTTSRKVHYNAHLKLRATKPDKVMDEAIGAVKAVGGYVEQQNQALMVFRIPVAKFMAVYKQLQSLGEVISKSISVTDISDVYAAVELRLKLAKTTLQRLQALLAKAETEKEKLQLLKEIQRVSEEVERLEGQFSTLDSLAKYSRLVLALEARLALQARSHKQDFKGFGWIHRLSPFEKLVAQGGKFLAFDVPEKMVALGTKQPWVVESADHVAFWASQRENQPNGNTHFWYEAIKTRLNSEFANFKQIKKGKYLILRLEDFSENPYVYMVGVHVVNKKIHLVEIYFPSKAHEEQYWSDIAKVIEKGAL